MAYDDEHPEEQAEHSQNPDGVNELSDEELEEVAGGWTEPGGEGSGTGGGG